MTPCRPEIVSPWWVDGSVVTVMGNTMPPRDPEDDEDDDLEGEDEDEDERQDEPAVIREPDE
jgi:hypothetical protein